MTGIDRLLNRLRVHGRPVAFCAMGRDVEDLGLGGKKRGQRREQQGGEGRSEQGSQAG